MNRSRRTWLGFALSLAVVLAALVGVSVLVLRLEYRESQSLQLADEEQRFRLALWRLDAAVAVVIATENARPPRDYIAPSPLEAGSPEPAQLHFELSARDAVGTPDTTAAGAARLARLQQLFSTHPPIGADTKVATSDRRSRSDPVPKDNYRMPAPPPVDNRKVLADAAEAEDRAVRAEPLMDIVPTKNEVPPEFTRLGNQAELSRKEASARAANYSNAQRVGQNSVQAAAPSLLLSPPPLAKSSGFKQLDHAASPLPQSIGPKRSESAADEVRRVGPLSPVWLGDQLFLVRRLRLSQGDDRIQGVWLDWGQWSGALAQSVGDLLESPRLIPVAPETTGGEDRRLVALPVRLEANAVSLSDTVAASTLWTPVRLVLGLAWVAILTAAAAVAWLLRGTLALSERRAAFVSAVTHELRTPLTTFRLYSEMLADDMVPDATQRQSYLATLRAEAVRLGHLVENVLSYARLEQGRLERPRETVTLVQLVQRIRERLDQRAAQAGMELDFAAPTEVDPPMRIRVDPSLIEQILFNLVDNACKYASPDSADYQRPRQIHLEGVRLPRERIGLRVRDHGPGLSPDVRQRLFEPFSKSAEQAAHSAPGVGLGLSLCRQLARSQGGDLVLETSGPAGTTFRLEFPSAPRDGTGG